MRHGEISARDKQLEDLPQPVQATTFDFPLRANQHCSRDKAVDTNHFLLDITAGTLFYEYEVTGFPVGTTRTRMRKLFTDAVSSFDFLDNSRAKFASDNLTTIIALESLHDDQTGNLDEEGNRMPIWGPKDVADGRKRGKVQPTAPLYVKYVGSIDADKLRTYHSGQGTPELWTSTPEIRAVNIIISKSFDGPGMIQAGANKFFRKPTKPVPLTPRSHDYQSGRCDSLYTIRGHFYTIKPALGGVLLNINATTGAFLKTQLVSQFLQDRYTIPDAKRRRDALAGVRVQIQYGRGKLVEEQQADLLCVEGRQKTIQSVSSKSISELQIKNKTRKPSLVSVKDYLVESRAPQHVL
jgi:hypothetical protein